MSDDTSKRGGQDRARINLAQAHEVQYWSERLGVSPGHLRHAVDEVGDRVEKVRSYLGRGRPPPARKKSAA